MVLVFLVGVPVICSGAETSEDTITGYLEEIQSQLEWEDLDQFTEENLPEKYAFSDLVTDLWSNADGPLNMEAIGSYVLDLFFYEFRTAKSFFVEILLLSILFAVMGRLFMDGNSYVKDTGFLVIYGALMVLLMQSFLLVNEIVTDGVTRILEFMEMLIPAYATTICLTGCISSGTVFYELTFGLILVWQWLVQVCLIPTIHIFVLMEFLDHLYEEEKLSRFAELIESSVGFALKLMLGCVVGLQTVQSFITSAQDRLAGNTTMKVMSILPGVGNALSSAGELLLGCGMLMKNSVGIAGVVVLFVICLTPLVKVFCFTLMYRLTGAILQPVADKRIVECVQGVARGCELYFKMLLNCMLLFFITVALVTASTSFVF